MVNERLSQSNNSTRTIDSHPLRPDWQSSFILARRIPDGRTSILIESTLSCGSPSGEVMFSQCSAAAAPAEASSSIGRIRPVFLLIDSQNRAPEWVLYELSHQSGYRKAAGRGGLQRVERCRSTRGELCRLFILGAARHAFHTRAMLWLWPHSAQNCRAHRYVASIDMNRKRLR